MKANEALGILSSDDIYNHIDTGRYSWEEIQEAVDILVRQQYTRTDAFIEKAVTYLEATLFNEVCYGEIRPDIVQAYINDFKKAMKLWKE